MIRRLGIGLCLLAVVAFMAIPAFAAVQNVKVSGDIKVLGVSRDNFDLKDTRGVNETIGTAAATATQDGVEAGVSITRVKVDADLSDMVSTTVRLINERLWGQEASEAGTAGDTTSTAVDIDLANITLKEFLYSPLTLTLGRQELRYGNGLIVGDPDSNLTSASTALGVATTTNNVRDLSARKAFDAVKAVLDYNPLTVDLIYAKTDENVARANDDITLIGTNLRYALDDKSTLLEAYYFGKITGSGATITNTTFARTAAEKIHTIGARAANGSIENLNLQAEAAFQFGDYDPALDVNAYTAAGLLAQKGHRRAWATQLIADLKLPRRFSPRLVGTYTYLSGEENTRQTGKYNGWASAFEDQTLGDIANAIMAPSNAHIFTITAQATPIENLTADITYAYFRLVEKFQQSRLAGLGDPNKPSLILSGIQTGQAYLMQTGEAELGSEVDVHLAYDYTEDVQLGLAAGIFMPGDAFAKSENQDPATQAIASVKVTF